MLAGHKEMRDHQVLKSIKVELCSIKILVILLVLNDS